jgi:hypothetical protein
MKDVTTFDTLVKVADMRVNGVKARSLRDGLFRVVATQYAAAMLERKGNFYMILRLVEKKIVSDCNSY